MNKPSAIVVGVGAHEAVLMDATQEVEVLALFEHAFINLRDLYVASF